MPRGGRIAIETSAVALDESEGRRLELNAGDYVLLTVSDTGHGIASEHLPHIFEPFFTTKEKGELINGHGISNSSVPFIQKPFSPDDLNHKIREVLDRRTEDVRCR
jgi:signal transduction histidine kinase